MFQAHQEWTLEARITSTAWCIPTAFSNHYCSSNHQIIKDQTQRPPPKPPRLWRFSLSLKQQSQQTPMIPNNWNKKIWAQIYIKTQIKDKFSKNKRIFLRKHNQFLNRMSNGLIHNTIRIITRKVNLKISSIVMRVILRWVQLTTRSI